MDRRSNGASWHSEVLKSDSLPMPIAKINLKNIQRKRKESPAEDQTKLVAALCWYVLLMSTRPRSDQPANQLRALKRRCTCCWYAIYACGPWGLLGRAGVAVSSRRKRTTKLLASYSEEDGRDDVRRRPPFPIPSIHFYCATVLSARIRRLRRSPRPTSRRSPSVDVAAPDDREP